MSFLSDTWGKAISWAQEQLKPRDPHSAYIDYKILERAVSAMPNPMNIVEGHEETYYKWNKMSEWVSRTQTTDETDKKNIRLASDSIATIANAVKIQSGRPVIQLDKSVLNDLLKNVEMIKLTASFYGQKPASSDPKVTYLRPSDELFARMTGIQPPTPNPSYPDRGSYITDFYKNIVQDFIPKTAPSRNWNI